MILANTSIHAAIESGALIVEPKLADEAISATSIDLRLGRHIYLLPTSEEGLPPFDPEEERIWDFWEKHGIPVDLCQNKASCRDDKRGYWLEPGEVCLASTLEKITLPTTGELVLQGMIWSRSRTARNFIRTHVDAPGIHPGTDHQITLEVKNEGPITTRLYYGMPIAQMSFEPVCGSVADSKSQFNGQKRVSGCRRKCA